MIATRVHDERLSHQDRKAAAAAAAPVDYLSALIAPHRAAEDSSSCFAYLTIVFFTRFFLSRYHIFILRYRDLRLASSSLFSLSQRM